MGQRLKLQSELQDLIGVRPDGKQNVYFQPPESVKLNYPCIVYNRDPNDIKYAENGSYVTTRRYELTIIDKDPDTELPDKLIKFFSMIRMSRYFVSDNLNHYSFTLYY